MGAGSTTRGPWGGGVPGHRRVKAGPSEAPAWRCARTRPTLGPRAWVLLPGSGRGPPWGVTADCPRRASCKLAVKHGHCLMLTYKQMSCIKHKSNKYSGRITSRLFCLAALSSALKVVCMPRGLSVCSLRRQRRRLASARQPRSRHRSWPGRPRARQPLSSSRASGIVCSDRSTSAPSSVPPPSRGAAVKRQIEARQHPRVSIGANTDWGGQRGAGSGPRGGDGPQSGATRLAV